MRKVSQFETPETAEKFRCFLASESIETREAEDDPQSVWVISDDDLDKAKALLEIFFTHPPENFSKAIDNGFLLKQQKIAQKLKQAQLHKQTLKQLQKTGYPVTMALIIISSIIFLLTQFGQLQIIYYLLMFPPVNHLSDIPISNLWRVVTPIFLHGSIFHIVFNMMWVYSIGPLVEARISSKKNVLLVFLIAAFSHILFFLVVGSNFVGMSGVIYGYIGFLWANDQISPYRNVTLDEGTFKFFVIWYVICWILSGLGIMHIANTIHGVGGFVGVVFGFLANGHWKKIQVRKVLTKSTFYNVALILAFVVGGMVVDYVTYR